MAGIYQAVFRKQDGTVALEPIETAIATVGNWLRLAPNFYLIHSNFGATEIYNAVVKHITIQDSIFVCRLDLSDRQGWYPKWVWDWIDARTVSPASSSGLAASLGPLLPPANSTGLGLINNSPTPTPPLPRNRLFDP